MASYPRATEVRPIIKAIGSTSIVDKLVINGETYNLDTLYRCTSATTFADLTTTLECAKLPIFYYEGDLGPAGYYVLQSMTADAYYFLMTADTGITYQVVCSSVAPLNNWKPSAITAIEFEPQFSYMPFEESDEKLVTTATLAQQLSEISGIFVCKESTTFQEIVDARAKKQLPVIDNTFRRNGTPMIISYVFYGYDEGQDAFIFVGFGTYQYGLLRCYRNSGWDTELYDISERHPKYAGERDFITAKGINLGLADKVDKVEGKALSTNDYSNIAKAKVDAIPANPKYTDTVYDDTAIKAQLANKINIDEANHELVIN